MANPFQVAGAQPARPSKKAPLYEGARFTSGLWSNRSPIRDAASTRLEEKFYGPRGDAFLGGENVEISQRLTLIRRPGNPVWNTNTWSNVNSFYEFRLFDSKSEQIKTMVDTSSGVYDASNNLQETIWGKASRTGQSYFQSIGNVLFWGDGASRKKWDNTLLQRSSYVRTNDSQNPYNFTPFSLNSFIIDSNGDVQQLIETVLQLSRFYIYNNYAVFSLKTTNTFGNLPEAIEIVQAGEEIYFSPSTQFASLVGETSGITLTIKNLSGSISTASPSFGGNGYLVGDVIGVDQSLTGAFQGTLVVSSIGSSGGTGYTNASGVATKSNKSGSGCTLTLTTSSGALVSAVVGAGGVNYSLGDYLFPQQNNAENGYFVVTGVSFGVVTSVALATGCVTGVNINHFLPGEGYTTADSVATAGGTGTGCTVNITDSQSQITCYYPYTGSSADTISLNEPGDGYVIGDILNVYQSSQSQSSGAQIEVDGLTGEVQSISSVFDGTTLAAYTAGACAYTTSGTGTGATFSISAVSGGFVTGVTVSVGGASFAVGDLIYITQGSAVGCIIQVATLSGSSVATVTILQGGYTPYAVATGLATTTSGTGTGATIDITSVASGAISSYALNAAGTGYVAGDLLYIYPNGSGGGTLGEPLATFLIVSLVGNTVPLSTYITTYRGTDYPFGVTLPTTGGTGTGCTVSLLYVTGLGILPHVSIQVNNGGTGYTAGNTIFPTWAGSSGALSFSPSILSPTPGPIAAFHVIDHGYGYVPATNVPLTGGSGTGATVNLSTSNGLSYFPSTSISDVPNIYLGGNPISDSSTNSQIIWGGDGETTIDGSALWMNRGASVDGGIVWNWGITGPTNAPTVIVNNAIGGWASNTYYNYWSFIVISSGPDKYVMQIKTSGKSGGSAPTWVTVPGQQTVDGTAVWMCLGNDADTSLSWAASQLYTPGHVLEETVSAVSCIFQLQPYSGIMTTGNGFPVYVWQCNSQHDSDVGSPGELPNGVSSNQPMAQNGTQSTASATWSSTMNSFFLSTGGGPISYSECSGDGTISGSPTQLVPGSSNLSVAMLPILKIPAAGTYTFKIGHQVGMFWGIGSGSLEIDITNIQILNNVLLVTCKKDITNLLSPGVTLDFSGLQAAGFLNGKSVQVVETNGFVFAATYQHSNYGPATDSGIVSSDATLQPSVVSGPKVWKNPGSPNTYDFSTGTPIKGYPIMSANLNPTQGTSIEEDTVQINFPAAGSYPAEIQYGVWYHGTGGYSTPTVSPTLPGTTFSFYLIYQKPNDTIYYNVIPEDLACSTALTPTFPAFPASLAAMQAIAPDYPLVVETSGNFTWWNLGPTASFNHSTSVNYTVNTFVVDPNGNKEIAYVPGVTGSSEPTFLTDLYNLTADVSPLIWMNNGPAGFTPTGELTTVQGGWKYCVALVNTLDDTVSNVGIVSGSTGSFFEATGVLVSGGLPAIIDPQADYVAIFRTKDGGSTFFLIPPPASGNGNTEYTIPLSQYLTQGFTDTTQDGDLNILLQAPLSLQNSVPPKGAINLAYQDGRIFVSVGNTAYWSSGPDAPIGNGYNAFSPNNYAEFPSLVKRLVPLNIGMLVFTVSDIFLITGNGTSSSPFVSEPFEQRIGLLSYNALTVNGSLIYFLSTDRQILELNVHYGVTQIGLPIADLAEQINPSDAYLTWHVNGAEDQCLFVADGSTGWYRMNPTPAPETSSGSVTWSLKANIVGGCGAIQSIETSPGNIQYLLGPAPGTSGPLLYRDYNSFEDNGNTYPANFILGSLVFAFPGQVAFLDFITTEAIRVSESLPVSLGIRVGEIAGEFEDLVHWTPDPPQLPPSNSLYNQRFYLSQTKQSVLCRHAQIYGEFAETNSADELISITVYGGYYSEP